MLDCKGFGTTAADRPLDRLAFKRRDVGENDVKIEILYCGVCHSDLHFARNEWHFTVYPAVPGHEIVGRVAQIGSTNLAWCLYLIISNRSAAETPKPKERYSGDSPTEPNWLEGPSALRRIIQEKCVLNYLQHRNPAPCERVFLADPKDPNTGYAVIAAPGGGAHYLLVPTQTMAGVESGELLDPDTPNYFAEAWRSRDLIKTFIGHEPARSAVGLAVGSARARTQNQFHIDIECLRPEVSQTLRAAAESVAEAWSPLSVAGSTYQAERITGQGLNSLNVYELLATLKPDARHHLADYTLIVAGMQFSSGPGFILLAGTGPSGEILLDSTCAVAGAGG